jgi:hypothetical protein
LCEDFLQSNKIKPGDNVSLMDLGSFRYLNSLANLYGIDLFFYESFVEDLITLSKRFSVDNSGLVFKRIEGGFLVKNSGELST